MSQTFYKKKYWKLKERMTDTKITCYYLHKVMHCIQISKNFEIFSKVLIICKKFRQFSKLWFFFQWIAGKKNCIVRKNVLQSENVIVTLGSNTNGLIKKTFISIHSWYYKSIFRKMKPDYFFNFVSQKCFSCFKVALTQRV